MSLGDLLRTAGGFMGVFELVRKNGGSVEREVEKFFKEESGLFSQAGFVIDKISDGYSEISFPSSQLVARHGGMVHGGIILFALDNAGGLAVMTRNPGVDQVTLELKVNFLEPLRASPYRAIGRELRHGRSVSVAEAEMRDANGKLCAKALGTWYLITEGRS